MKLVCLPNGDLFLGGICSFSARTSKQNETKTKHPENCTQTDPLALCCVIRVHADVTVLLVHTD